MGSMVAKIIVHLRHSVWIWQNSRFERTGRSITAFADAQALAETPQASATFTPECSIVLPAPPRVEVPAILSNSSVV
jgi:hypothetical protein